MEVFAFLRKAHSGAVEDGFEPSTLSVDTL